MRGIAVERCSDTRSVVGPGVIQAFQIFLPRTHVLELLRLQYIVQTGPEFLQRFVVVFLDALLVQILDFPAGRFVRILVGKNFRRKAIQRGTSVAGKVFR